MDLVEAPQATWLDIILYSREQLIAEREALPRSGPVADLPEAPWGIVSIKGQVQPLFYQPKPNVTSGVHPWLPVLLQLLYSEGMAKDY